MSKFDDIIFDGVKFGDILKEIHNNQQTKKKQITQLIQELKPMIQDLGDATLLLPQIQSLLDTSVKNDDALLKMATIVQRHVAKSATEDDYTISDKEREELLSEINKLNNTEE